MSAITDWDEARNRPATASNPYQGWYTIQQAAATLGVSEKTVSRMAADGRLFAERVKVAGDLPRYLYDPEKVDALLAQKRAEAGPLLLAAPAVEDEPEPGEPEPLPLSELRFKVFLTTQEAVRYSGLPEAVLVQLHRDGRLPRLTNMKPYRYARRSIDYLGDLTVEPV